MDGGDAEIERRAGVLLQEVLRRAHLGAASDIATVVAEEARTIGVDPLVLYLVDYEQKWLIPVPGPATEGREPLPVQGTVAGRAYTSTSIVESQDEGPGRRLWLPLVDGTERLGVTEMTLAGDGPLVGALLGLCERYSHMIA